MYGSNGMRITEEMTEIAYSYSKKVYGGIIERDKAVSYLEKNHNMNRNSAADYINNFKCMVNGNKYTRTNNAYATEYFLKNILLDYGLDKLGNALSAVKQHIDYYEELRGVNLHKIRRVYEKYSAELYIHKSTMYPDELPDSGELFEGLKKQVTVNSFERNLIARQECIEHYGSKCFVCGFDFSVVYGELGKGFIHVHHLVEISTIGRNYKVNPIADLRPVCPNCHAMLHRDKPAYTIEQLKEITNKISNNHINSDW